ncbi:MAG: OmpA family protein [Sneathiella sp.]|nr:OmpA family protein [Sneathiella sp.]
MQFKYDREARRKHQSTIWLTSLADLLALLLAFFVLLFAMNEVKDDSWQDLLDTLGYRLNTQVTDVEEGPTAEKNLAIFKEQKAFDLDYLEKILGEKILASDDLKNIDVFRAQDRLILSFAGEGYFNLGADVVSTTLVLAVRELGDSLRHIKNRLEIYGHTDPSPMTQGTSALQNNWGLSLARAISVADILTKAGYSFPIRTFGMADSRFYELSDIPDLQKRFSLARRVDIVIREADGRGKTE